MEIYEIRYPGGNSVALSSPGVTEITECKERLRVCYVNYDDGKVRTIFGVTEILSRPRATVEPKQ